MLSVEAAAGPQVRFGLPPCMVAFSAPDVAGLFASTVPFFYREQELIIDLPARFSRIMLSKILGETFPWGDFGRY